ncbi:MAG TPA: response regulator [Sulfurimonas sp.]|nr:response regulator [Sulfurimonas sp.]
MNITQMKVLSVFDDASPFLIIREYVESLSLKIDDFTDSQQALTSAKSTSYDLVLIEHTADSFDVLAFIRAFRHMYRETPILVLIDANDMVVQEKVLRLGAFDIICKPLSPVVFQATLQNALKLTKAESLLNDKTVLLQEEIKNATKTFKDSEHELLAVLGKSTQYKEHQGDKHTLVIAHSTKALARLAGLNEKIQDVAFHASQIYDLGKVGVPDELLLKADKLTHDEFEVVKKHAKIGYDFLKYSQNSYLKAGAVISFSHHEKFDGSGYPIGLSGETIPILGRIVAIVDVFEALTSEKVYKKAWTIEDACDYLIGKKGKHFDPKLVDLFIDNLEEMLAIRNEFK